MKPAVNETAQIAAEVSTFQNISPLDRLRDLVHNNAELQKKVDLYRRYSENLEEIIEQRDQDLRMIQNFWAQDERDYSSEANAEYDYDSQEPEEFEYDLETVDISDEDEARGTFDDGQEPAARNSLTAEYSTDSPIDTPVNSAAESPAESPVWPISPPRILQNTWILEPDAHDEIEHAEALMKEGKMQAALAHLSTQCPSTKEFSLHINATLLQSCALRSVGSFRKALELAESALYIANLNDIHQLVSKSQYHRGLALLDLGLFADAHCCFVRAASIKWYARDVERLMRETERKRNALPLGANGSQLSASFQVVPTTTKLSGFGAVNR